MVLGLPSAPPKTLPEPPDIADIADSEGGASSLAGGVASSVGADISLLADADESADGTLSLITGTIASEDSAASEL